MNGLRERKWKRNNMYNRDVMQHCRSVKCKVVKRNSMYNRDVMQHYRKVQITFWMGSIMYNV